MKAIVQPPDVAPTILDAAGCEVPDAMQGRSILPLMSGSTRAIRDCAVTSPAILADALSRGTYTPSTLTAGRWSLVYSPASTKGGRPSDPERGPAGSRRGATTEAVDSIRRRQTGGLFPDILLYDLKTDPHQQKSVAAKHPEVVRKLHRRYVRLLEDLGTQEEYLAPRREI
jgi:hypothetical protein